MFQQHLNVWRGASQQHMWSGTIEQHIDLYPEANHQHMYGGEQTSNTCMARSKPSAHAARDKSAIHKCIARQTTSTCTALGKPATHVGPEENMPTNQAKQRDEAKRDTPKKSEAKQRQH